ncbi:hydroxyproline-rich glycoprotein family protein [Parasponia andersonii]|uniref:Hydroxyproline-rich glycoprotein family protein n=1 Tax=Parasponia andersonii TaxID=3476 RepID=A0A2P5DZQ0_PARAD|nr:hydroxyproline-rich glycoprotein family protein [Parasponia andersonii]
MDWFKAIMLVKLFLMISTISALHLVNGLDSRKLDETPVPSGTDEKCTPCIQYSPPPPPPPPPKKPPSPPSPTTQYCPPPPAAFLYITGPPGDLYPIDPDFNSAAGKSTNLIMSGLPALIGFGLFGVLASW